MEDVVQIQIVKILLEIINVYVKKDIMEMGRFVIKIEIGLELVLVLSLLS